jgi:3-oxoacyl-[acyl-carrier-protein] synthase-1
MHPDATAAVQLIGLGFANEESSIMNDSPLLGIGMKEAAQGALTEAQIRMDQVAFRLSDAAGEGYAFREQALVVARLLRVHRDEEFPLWHCAEYVGETGAAAGLLQLVVAYHAFQKRYAPGTIAMCFTSSDSGRRAVALLAATSPVK